MEIRRFDAGVEPGRLAEALAADGCAVIDRLVPTSTVDALRTEIAPWLDATPNGPDDFSGFSTTRTGALLARSATARQLVMHPTIRATVGAVLSHATTHQLHLTQVIAIGPGETEQPIHRDQWAFDFFPFPAGLRGAVQHPVGAHRLHGGERRHPSHSGHPTTTPTGSDTPAPTRSRPR